MNNSEPVLMPLREQLAQYAHDAWSGWMRYLFRKCEEGLDGDEFPDGSMQIPTWAVERWQRQMDTLYAELPEEEKESDRAEADKMLAIVGQALKNDLRAIYRLIGPDVITWQEAMEGQEAIKRLEAVIGPLRLEADEGAQSEPDA